MNSEWPAVPLEELTDDTSITYGVVKPGDECVGGVRFIRGGDVVAGRVLVDQLRTISPETSRQYARTLLRGGELLVSLVGNPGEVAIVPVSLKGANIARQVGLIRIDETKAHARYVQYFLRSKVGRDVLLAHSKGSVQQVINLKDLKSVKVPLPPVRVQQNVAAFMQALDDRIALLLETNATLEAIAQALFKSWFVDFDPVRAKQQGLAPEGMDEATAGLFPDGFEESELGLVPKGWQLVPFGTLLSHTIGGDWGGGTPDEKNDSRVAIIRGTDIPDLQSGASSRVPIRYTSKKKLATRKLQDGDIVLEVSGGSKDQPTGRALYLTGGMLSQFDCPVEPASFCRLLRPLSSDVGLLLAQHLSYIYAQGKTWEYQNQSTGIANFQTTHFLETELVGLPSPEVLSVFASSVRPMVERKHLTQIQQLAALRDTLLPRLISGQLHLSDLDVSEIHAPTTPEGMNPTMIKRSISELHFVKGRNPKPTVEVQADSLEERGLYVGEVVESALSRFAAKNPNVIATIYTYGTVSVNFHEQGWSEFLIVAGEEKVLKELGRAFSSLAGGKSRYSDYISPSEGSCAFHIEDGLLWEPEDAVTWYAVVPDNEQEELVESAVDKDEKSKNDDDDWDDVIQETEPEAGQNEDLNEPAATGRVPEQAARYRVARSDARVASIRQTIERVFGLPEGSVALCGPDGRALRGDAFIRTLRRRWEEA